MQKNHAEMSETCVKFLSQFYCTHRSADNETIHDVFMNVLFVNGRQTFIDYVYGLWSIDVNVTCKNTLFPIAHLVFDWFY